MISTKSSVKVLTTVLFLAILALLMIAFASVSHARTDSRVPNPLTLAFTENPNTYNFGYIAGGQIFSRDGKLYTNIQFKPERTFMLYTESITFCGNEAERLSGKTGSVILTYSRIMHNRDCHDLYNITEIPQVKQ